MSWGIVASVGGSIVGGLLSSNAAGDAAQAQTDSAAIANAGQQQMYQQNRADMEPWRKAGEGSLNKLALLMGIPGYGDTDPAFGKLSRNFGMSDFEADPGYNFRLTEGMKALQNSAAARGTLMSGSTMKGLQRFGQGLASDEYTNAFNRFNTQNTNLYNRLAGISGTGQVSANQIAQQGANAASIMGQNTIGAGNAQAAGRVGAANAFTGAIGQGMNFYNNNRLLGMLSGNSGTPWGTGGGGDSFSGGAGFDPYAGMYGA